jgi:ATP-dependent Clp protease ATP-binding subunit ClpA
MSLKVRKQIALPETSRLSELLSERVIGQPAAVLAIVPYVEMFHAGLAPGARPAGVFLLLGPTGTGKTKTVEALAEVLHGDEKNLLKVDCGEFQMEHEVAKLIGAPPGYLGHRETQPMLTQAKINSVASEHSPLSLILFDEIEKAAPSMTRLLMGVLDKAILRLGDNTTVNFERTLIFLTSNLGAREMNRELRPDFGFEIMTPRADRGTTKLDSIGLAAVKRKFSPEFVNRIDAVVTYQPLSSESLAAILDHSLDCLQVLINVRLGQRAFVLDVSSTARRFLLQQGTSAEYGARELKRTLHRHLMQPIASLLVRGQIDPGCRVRAALHTDKDRIVFEKGAAASVAAAA